MTLVTQHIDSLTTELMRLNFMAQEITANLNAQNKLLNLRQMTLNEHVLSEVHFLVETMQQLAEQVEEEQHELAQLRALALTAEWINSSVDFEEVITRAMDLVIDLTDAQRGYIMLLNERTGKYEFIVARNMDQSDINQEEFAVSRTVIDEVIQTAKPRTTENAREDPRLNLQDSIVRFDMRSIMCVPMLYQNDVKGVIYVDNPRLQGTFGRKEERLMMAFANQAAIAIENARLFAQVKRQIQEVAEFRQFLDNVFASIASGVITTDAEANVRTINPALERMLDLPAEDCIGRPLLEVLPPLYEGFKDLLHTVQTEGRVEVVEVNAVLPNRGPSFLNFKISPLREEDNNTVGVAIVVDDLTEIKRSEEKLNVIETYIPPALLVHITNFDNLGLGGEERVISVLFADVRGFTSFSENLEPEQVMEIINQYLTIGAEAINAERGIIDKYMGDAIVGLFNTQLNASEDHAVQAVRTAVETINGVIAFHEQLPEALRLSYGIGIHTDWAMLGNVGSPSRKEFTALGNAVTYAKKLQEIAQPNEVIISPETYEQVRDYVDVEPVQRSLRTETISAYRIVGLT